MTCANCKRQFNGRKDKRTCSDRCRQALARWRRSPRGRRAARESATRAARARTAARGPGSWQVQHAAIQDLDVEPGSLDVVFTDPPYPAEFLPCWDALATFAATALKPGGVLVALSGQSCLPEVMRRLGVDGLEYRWTLAVDLPGASTTIWPVKVQSNWKPALIYYRPPFASNAVNDVVKAEHLRNQADNFHEWGQQPGVADGLASRFIEPGHRVGDPFAGGGEFALAAYLRGAHVLASDSSETAVETLLRVTDSVTAVA